MARATSASSGRVARAYGESSAALISRCRSRAVAPAARAARCRDHMAYCWLVGGREVVDIRQSRATRSGARRTRAMATIPPRDSPARANRGGSSSSSRCTWPSTDGSVRIGVTAGPTSMADQSAAEQFKPGSKTSGSSLNP